VRPMREGEGGGIQSAGNLKVFATRVSLAAINYESALLTTAIFNASFLRAFIFARSFSRFCSLSCRS